MKKKLSVSLAALMLAAAMPAGVYGENNISIVINGTPIDMEYAPVVEGGRTLVPFRQILEEMGAKVGWNSITKTVSCSLEDRSVEMTIGSDTMLSDGEEVSLDVPAKIIESRTYVPLRAISEGLGAVVDWDAGTKTVSIYTDSYEARETDEAEAAADEKEAVDATISDNAKYSLHSYSNSIMSGSTTAVPVTAEYPVFKGNGRAVSSLNKYIAEDAKGRVNSYKTSNSKRLYSLYQQSIKDGTRDSFNNYKYDLSYQVKNTEDDILSLYVTETIITDTDNKTTVWGLTLSSKTGNVITANELYENAAEAAKTGFIGMGFDSSLVNRQIFDDSSFYIENGRMIYAVNAGIFSDKIEEFSLKLPEKEAVVSTSSAVYAEETVSTDTLYAQDNTIIMKLKTSYPQFVSGRTNVDELNALIKKTQETAMASFKEDNRADTVAAYKSLENTKTKKYGNFEPWAWTSDYEVKYNNGTIASIVTSVYIHKGDNESSTTYSAYICDFKTGKLVDVNTLINDTAKTDSAARAAFKAKIDKDRLNYYTDVYERFDLSRATKYISADGVTYMFNPGELASVSKGVIEVTVPMS